MDFLAISIYLLIGVYAGFLAGLLGLSGGVFTVPSLLLVFHYLNIIPPVNATHIAIGTSLAAMAFAGATSTVMHQHHRSIVWELVLSMFSGIFLGSLFGAFIAHFLRGAILQVLFGIFIMGLGIYTFLKKQKKSAHNKPMKPIYAINTWAGLGVGTLASLLGVGGAVFTVPLLLSYHYTEQKAIGTASAISLCITTFGAIAYLYFGMETIKLADTIGYIYLPAFIAVGFSSAIFAPIGARLTHKINNYHLRMIFAATLILIGLLMFIF